MKLYLETVFNNLSNKFNYLNDIDITFSIPANPNHGDFSTNAALLLTKKLGKNPRSIAEQIIKDLEIDKSKIAKVEIAGPGFINFFFSHDYVTQIIPQIAKEKNSYGRSDKYKGKKAIVEFVSANPTGPLTVGHGRNAVVGDTVSNFLEMIGYEVDREYYFNNAGRQMRVLADSVRQRYLQLLGDDNDFPEDYYQGEYIKEIAQKIFEEKGDLLKSTDDLDYFKKIAETEIFTDIKKTLEELNIIMKNFYNENTLYEEGKIDRVITSLRDKNLVYEKDGAVWFKLSELGNDADKVIVKSTGEPTYRLPDIAYHETKFERGYDLIVDLFGSDHNATYPDVLAGLKSLDHDISKVKVLIHQFVTIVSGKEVVKMSTRKANYITLDELVNEVGKDVVRYFFIMRSISSHLNFDLEVAKKQSDENPVFYLQYAHARICSILRMTEEQGLKSNIENINLLVHPVEQSILKKLYEFKNEVLLSSENFEIHKIANYLESLAAIFHKFYTECRIIGTEKGLAEARIALIIAVNQVLRNGLRMLGISAPEKM